MVSLGDWKWDSDATGYVYDEMGNAMTKAGTVTTPGAEDHAKAVVKMNGVRVGGSAQTTAAVGANVNITKALRVGADWTYYGRNYAYYAVDGTILSVGKRDGSGRALEDTCCKPVGHERFVSFQVWQAGCRSFR